MEVDLVMILHLVIESASSVTQDTRLQEVKVEPAHLQVHGVGVSQFVQVSLSCRQISTNYLLIYFYLKTLKGYLSLS